VAPVRSAMTRVEAKRRTLIVGGGRAGVLVADKIEAHPELGLTTVGFVDDGPRRSVRGRPEPLLGKVSQLREAIAASRAQVVIFGYTKNDAHDMLVALYECAPHVEVLMMPRFFQYVSAGMRVENMAGMPLLRVSRSELTSTERFLKRAEDLVLGGLVTLLCLPFLPLLALAIKLDSPGPIFYTAERVGRGGKPFRMYKFRSMMQSADEDTEALARLAEEDPRGLKNKTDERVTRLGAFLRKSSIDEIPQIINVLKGEMSLVGPRPAVAAEVAAYDEWQRKRLQVAPGITGMWQVNGRSDVPFDERIWLDFSYVDAWSLWLDVSILLKTVPAVLSARGAY
jgi:exopolysaccharide biosynthesis polyprenyl glycosylphosphotransferase